jgi:hypothetical protein
MPVRTMGLNSLDHREREEAWEEEQKMSLLTAVQ